MSNNEYWYLDKPINEIILDNIRKNNIGKIAWSDYFGRYIVCVKYINNNEWYFKFVNDESEDSNKVLKAKSPYDKFNWTEWKSR